MASRRSPRAEALSIWKAGVAAVHAGRLVESAVLVRGNRLRLAGEWFDLSTIPRIGVVGGGKAGAVMVRALEERLGKRVLTSKSVSGSVNVPLEQVAPLRCVTLENARSTHDNKPTSDGVRATVKMLEFLGELASEDLVICLISGGGSALLPAPASGLTLGDKQKVTDLLHAAGATINEVNAVRKHLSRLKGGQLARSTRARVASLIVSDVVGDPIDVIASGPTAVDPTTYQDALDVLKRYRLLARAPGRAVKHLREGKRGTHPETLKRGSPRISNHLIGNNQAALEAAEMRAGSLGYRVINLSSCLEGDSRELGIFLAGLARGIRDQLRPGDSPVCILSGGETTVNLGPRPGKGGRNQELVLGALVHLAPIGLERITVLSAGTDGEDGPTDAAGAVADARVLLRSRRRGLDPSTCLAGHDAYPFFDTTLGLVRTGPTHTNVMDLRVVLVQPPPR